MPAIDPAFNAYQRTRRAHWDSVGRCLAHWRGWGGYYQQRLLDVYRFLVPPGQRVLELGCGEADLLAGLQPAFGVGVDFSRVMLARARDRHPSLLFIEADAACLPLGAQFDVVILSDLVNDVWDVQSVLEHIRPFTHASTRLIINLHSRLWELPLKVAQQLRLARPNLAQNWLTVEDLQNLLRLGGYETIRAWQEIMLPLRAPLASGLANRVLVRLGALRHLAMVNFVVARPRPVESAPSPRPSLSIVIPARNETGNIEAAFARIPDLGVATELIFVEGHSHDDTYGAIEAAITRHPERTARLFRQAGKGKANAVRLGFREAHGDILLILDADLTMPPESLGRFYQILATRQAEFANGVRLVYPMHDRAMRFLNLIGNKLFGLAFSWLLGQSVKDTLCGTKGMWRSDYQRIEANRSYFGEFDPFGDFDLLFGAAKLNLKIADIPIRYAERTYGSTNINRFRDGWLLLRMTVFAARRLKFV